MLPDRLRRACVDSIMERTVGARDTGAWSVCIEETVLPCCGDTSIYTELAFCARVCLCLARFIKVMPWVQLAAGRRLGA